VLFALRRERMFFQNQSDFQVLETGVGRDAVQATLDRLFDHDVVPPFVVYAGFAGGLDPALRIGDVLLADTILDESGRSWPATWPSDSTGIRRGRLLTTERLLGSVADKQRLREIHQAEAVDMEAAFVAARCAERHVPFGCVRAISDTADTPLSPALVGLLSGGVLSPWRASLAAARHPALLGEFWRLARDTRWAAHQLASALHVLLSATGAESRQSG
jgi:adenosylhomocysteine nucleosidase